MLSSENFWPPDEGLGYLIIYGSQVFQLDMVISSILLLCVIAMLLYLLTTVWNITAKSTATDLSEIRRRILVFTVSYIIYGFVKRSLENKKILQLQKFQEHI